MLSYFRLNDPFRLVAVLLFLTAFKLPILLAEETITLQELNWMLLGERLAQGKLIYTQVIDNIAPLSALVYWSIFELFGKSWLSFHIIAILLVGLQGFYLNQGFNKSGIFNEKTFVPLLTYVLFTTISFDLGILSPALMSVTFLAMALKNLLVLDSQSPVTDSFKIGIYLGIASLFYLPTIIFLPVTILCLALFRTSSIKALLNVISGFFLPIILLILFFWFQNNLTDFYRFYIKSVFLSKTWLYNFTQLAYLFSFPALLLVVSIFKLKTSRGFINSQQNSHWMLIIWTIFTFLALLISPKLSSTSFIIFAPVFAFFLSQWLLLQKNKLLAEGQLLGVIIVLVAICYTVFFQLREAESPFNNIVVKPTKNIQEQKIMVLGQGHEMYYGNTIASPFLNWKISENFLGEIDKYSTINFLKNSILEDKPTLIIDKSKELISKKMFKRMPLLLDYYKKILDEPEVVYQLIDEKEKIKFELSQD